MICPRQWSAGRFSACFVSAFNEVLPYCFYVALKHCVQLLCTHMHTNSDYSSVCLILFLTDLLELQPDLISQICSWHLLWAVTDVLWRHWIKFLGPNSLCFYWCIIENWLCDDWLGINCEKHIIRREKYTNVKWVRANVEKQDEKE